MPLAFARSVLTGGSSKSFTLTRSASNVNEGSSVTFTLNSTGMNGESVPYTITGITDSDLSSGSLTGNIVINSDETGSASVTTKADFHTEGAENLTFTIGSAYQQYADSNGYSTSVTVNDTSLTPRVDSITRSAASVNEGSYVDLTFNTSNCRTNAGTAGTRIYFKITGIQAADISSVSGTNSSPQNGPPPVNASTIATEYGYVVTNGTSSPYIRLNMNADQLTEGSQTLTCTVTRLHDYEGPGDGTVAVDGVTSQTVTINDTSVAHPVGQIFLVPGTTANSSGGTQPDQGNQFNHSYFNPNYSGNKTNQNTNTVTNYNWTVPSGVSDIAVAVVSAGGSGPFSDQNAYSGGGGGGGGLGAAKFQGLQGGQSYLITVGKAGNVGKASGNSWFRSSNVRQSIYVNAGRSPGITTAANANLGAAAQHSDSQSNSNTGRAGGTVQFGNSYDSGVGSQGNFTRHEGTGGAGGRGYYYNNSQAGGGGGGAGGWGRVNYGQNGYGGQGGKAAGNGNVGQNGAGGGGGSANWGGGLGGGVGLAGPGNSGNGGSGSGAGNAGSPWGGYEYGYGGAGGSPNQSGVSGGCGAVRVVWTSGATWE